MWAHNADVSTAPQRSHQQPFSRPHKCATASTNPVANRPFHAVTVHCACIHVLPDVRTATATLAYLHGDWPLQLCDLLNAVDAASNAAVHAQDLALNESSQRQPVEQRIDALPHPDAILITQALQALQPAVSTSNRQLLATTPLTPATDPLTMPCRTCCAFGARGSV